MSTLLVWIGSCRTRQVSRFDALSSLAMSAIARLTGRRELRLVSWAPSQHGSAQRAYA
jgi:hypothetical protein